MKNIICNKTERFVERNTCDHACQIFCSKSVSSKNSLSATGNISQGRIQGGAHPARAPPPPPLKLEKIWFLGVKSWFFTRNTPKIFAPLYARRNLFKCAPPNLKSWIRPCILSFFLNHLCRNKHWHYWHLTIWRHNI